VNFTGHCGAENTPVKWLADLTPMKQIKRFHWASRVPITGSTFHFDRQRRAIIFFPALPGTKKNLAL